MKHRRLLNIYFCKNNNNLNTCILNETEEIAFPPLVSCNSNESSWTLTIKNINFIEGNVLSVLSFSFIILMVSEKTNFEFFFENLPFMLPCQPIKSSDLDKSHINHGGLLNKHFCNKKIQISLMTWQKLSISTFCIISLWKV